MYYACTQYWKLLLNHIYQGWVSLLNLQPWIRHLVGEDSLVHESDAIAVCSIVYNCTALFYPFSQRG